MVTKLTPKEQEILECLVKGSLNKEISDKLSIALDTVKKHTTSIYKKLDVRNRSEAIIWYMQCQSQN